MIREIFNQITKLESLKPEEPVNLLFSSLVELATSDSDILDDLTFEEIDLLQKLCAHSEFELEKHWSNRIIGSKEPLDELRTFPYFNNYVKLTKVELGVLQLCDEHDLHNVLFLGSGPLPLTAIVMALNHGVTSTIVDIDSEAVDLSKKLVRVLGLDEYITVIHSDAKDYKSFDQFNTIYLAALAGIDEEAKEGILNSIKSQSKAHTHILARSAWGNRRLLYKPLSKNIFKSLKAIYEFNPHNDIVNSFVIFEVN